MPLPKFVEVPLVDWLAAQEDKLNMDWLAKNSHLIAHPINYRSEWDGDLRKRLNAYREILGERATKNL